MLIRFAALIICLARLSAAGDETAQLLFPQVGQRGTTVELTALGSNLDQAEEILFYRQGIRTVSIEPATEIPDFRGGKPRQAAPGTALTLKLAIAADAPLGEHLIRIRTRDNLSEALRFHVTPLPVIFEENPFVPIAGQSNDSSDTAQPVPLNHTIAGYLLEGPPQDEDWYRVDLEKGQRLTAEAVAARLGTWHRAGMNDPSLTIFGPDGTELARNDDNALHAQDPIVSIIAPTTGTYRVLMRQQMDYETLMRHYALHIGDFPRPLVTFPLGGEAGKPLKFELIGDALTETSATLALPDQAGKYEKSRIPCYAAANSPSPSYLQVAPFRNLLEEGDPTSEKNPQTIDTPLPVALNGRIESEGEADWFRIRAKAGEKYRVRVFAATLGSDLDPKLILRPAPGNTSKLNLEEDDSPWEAHDMIGHPYRWQIRDRLDPIFIFEPDQDGDYLLAISDKRREFSPSHIYRIEFQPHRDSTFVHFGPYPSQPHTTRDRIVIPRGTSASRPALFMKGFGSSYSGPLQLRATGLPDGVTLTAPPFKAGDPSIPLLFHTARDTPLQSALVEFAVEPVDPKHRAGFDSSFIQNIPATNRRGDFVMKLSSTRYMALAVVDEPPFDIVAEQPEIGLVQNGELKLKLKVSRRPDFKDAIYCEADWLPNGVNKQPPLIIPADKESADYTLTARADTPTGTYPVSITARANEGGNVRYASGFQYVSTPFIQLEISSPYLAITLERSAIERGKSGTITARIKHLKPYQGEAVLELGRLPFGTRLIPPLPAIKAGESTATFNLEVSQDCLVNQYKDIFCQVSIKDGGQTIRQQSGNGTLRVDPSRN